jgi:hypothetical protein
MDLNALPRAIALQYDRGELVYPAGGQPVLREYSYNGSGLRTFGKPLSSSMIRGSGKPTPEAGTADTRKSGASMITAGLCT